MFNVFSFDDILDVFYGSSRVPVLTTGRTQCLADMFLVTPVRCLL